MLRDLEDLSRRKLLKLGGTFRIGRGDVRGRNPADGVGAQSPEATPTVELPPITEIPENLKGSGEVVVRVLGRHLPGLPSARPISSRSRSFPASR